MAYNQNSAQRGNDEVSFDIREYIEVIGVKDNGWKKEVNVVAWNGGNPKIDVREWDPSHARMSRGITLFDDEAEKLAEALSKRYGLLSMPTNTQNRRYQNNTGSYAAPANRQNTAQGVSNRSPQIPYEERPPVMAGTDDYAADPNAGLTGSYSDREEPFAKQEVSNTGQKEPFAKQTEPNTDQVKPFTDQAESSSDQENTFAESVADAAATMKAASAAALTSAAASAAL